MDVDAPEGVDAPQSSTPSLKCFLSKYCACSVAHDNAINKVIQFQEDKFEKCHLSLHVRKTLKLKYNDVRLSKRISLDIGYHAKCYKDFTALKLDYVAKSEQVKPYQPVESRAYSPTQRSDSEYSGSSSPSDHDDENRRSSDSSAAERYVLDST